MDNDNRVDAKRPATLVRFTSIEFQRIQKMARTTGLSIPEILRKNTFSRTDLESALYTREDADRVIAELRRIGNNINQIAKQINAGLMSGWNQAFNSLTRAFVDLRHLIAVNRANR